jgi:hypothetical protein
VPGWDITWPAWIIAAMLVGDIAAMVAENLSEDRSSSVGVRGTSGTLTRRVRGSVGSGLAAAHQYTMRPCFERTVVTRDELPQQFDSDDHGMFAVPLKGFTAGTFRTCPTNQSSSDCGHPSSNR